LKQSIDTFAEMGNEKQPREKRRPGKLTMRTIVSGAILRE
jgi:hypothetical protein